MKLRLRISYRLFLQLKPKLSEYKLCHSMLLHAALEWILSAELSFSIEGLVLVSKEKRCVVIQSILAYDWSL